MSETDSPETFEVLTDRWAYGGEVMGRLPDGRAVFIPFSIPGEKVRIRLVEEKRGFARAELLEVLEPSPRRIVPRCKHYTVCGGCHYQHLAYPDQLKAKTAVLEDTLARIGKFTPEEIEAVLQPVVPSEREWHYRNYVQFQPDAEGRLGFSAPRSDEIIPIEECHLPEEALNQLWPRLEFEPIPGLFRVGMRVGAEDEIILILDTEDDEGLDFALDMPLAAIQIGPNSRHILSDRAEIEVEAAGYTFQVSGGAFFQVNTGMAEAMVEHLMARLPLTPESTVLDVYCGGGLFSAFIAPEVGRLIGIEEHPLAVEDFTVNLDAYDNVEIYQAPAEIVLPTLELSPEVILVDPPRAGIALSALDAIIAMKPGTLAYVSCDPSTFGRDAKRLRAGGFTLKQITPFDLFPQTYHIETVSIWEG